jgi:hypothetical protein
VRQRKLDGWLHTRLVVWGGAAAIACLIVSLVILAIGGPGERAGLIVLASVMLAEGLALITNWRGGLDEVVRVLRGARGVDSYVARNLGRHWFVRAVVAPFWLYAGGAVIFVATRAS